MFGVVSRMGWLPLLIAALSPFVRHSSALALEEVPGLCSTQFVVVATQGELDVVLQSLPEGPNGGAFTLDADAGAVIFGDGERGRVPETRPGTPPQNSAALRYQDRAVTANDSVLVTSFSHAPVARIQVDGCP